MRSVFEGLVYEGGITGAARETLSRARQVQQEKRARLHADWQREVYDKIESRIQQAVDARSVNAIEKRLQRNAQVRWTIYEPLTSSCLQNADTRACTACSSALIRSEAQYTHRTSSHHMRKLALAGIH